MLGMLQLIGATLDQVEVSIGRGELDPAVGILESAREALEKLEGLDEIIVVALMKEKSKNLRKLLLERVEEAWSALVKVDRERGEVTLKEFVESTLHRLQLIIGDVS